MLTLTEITKIAGTTKSNALRLCRREGWTMRKLRIDKQICNVYDVDEHDVFSASQLARQRHGGKRTEQKRAQETTMKSALDQLFVLTNKWG